MSNKQNTKITIQSVPVHSETRRLLFRACLPKSFDTHPNTTETSTLDVHHLYNNSSASETDELGADTEAQTSVASAASASPICCSGSTQFGLRSARWPWSPRCSRARHRFGSSSGTSLYPMVGNNKGRYVGEKLHTILDLMNGARVHEIFHCNYVGCVDSAGVNPLLKSVQVERSIDERMTILKAMHENYGFVKPTLGILR